MVVRLSPSWWLTANCSDPNTSYPLVQRREQRGPERQTSSISELQKQTHRFKQKCTGIHIFQALLSLPLCFLFSLVLPLSLHKLWSLIWKGLRMWKTHNTQLLFYSVLFYFPDLTWPVRWLECVAMGMGGAWVEERDHIEERSKLSSPGTTGLRSKAAWFMAYGLPHWGETVQFLHEDTADVVANSHASSCSVKVLHQKYPRYFLGVDVFRDTFQCVLKVKQRPYCDEWYLKVRLIG